MTADDNTESEPGKITAKRFFAMRNALEMVLLFHDGGPWGDAKVRRWKQLTGHTDATTRIMCDQIRRALE